MSTLQHTSAHFETPTGVLQNCGFRDLKEENTNRVHLAHFFTMYHETVIKSVII